MIGDRSLFEGNLINKLELLIFLTVPKANN